MSRVVFIFFALAVLLIPSPAGAGERPCQVGWTAFEERDYKAAAEHFSRCLERDPDNVLLLVLRGLSYNERGEYDRAERDYERALELDPEEAGVYLLPGAFGPTNRVFWGTERARGGD